MPRPLALLGYCLCLLAAAPVAAQTAATTTPPAQTALTQTWQTRVRLDTARGHMTHLVLQGNTLFVQNDRAEVEALDAETGRSLWATIVGRPDFPSVPVAANPQQVVLANGSTLYALDRSTGGTLWTRQLKGSPSSGAAINNQRVYMPMLSGAMEGYMLVPKTAVDRAPLIFFGKGESESPPVVTDTRLMWATTKGNVYIDSLTSSLNRVRFVAGGPIAGRLTYRSPRVFFTSLDGFVYAIDEASGAKIWEFSLAGPIHQPPVAIGDALYVVADAGGMWKLAADSGAQLWFVPGATQFVAASAFRIYAADQLGQLLVLDGATGARLGAFDTISLPIKYRNHDTDRVYLGNASGYLSCFHEAGLSQPMNHLPPPAKKQESTVPKKKAAAAAAAEPAAEPPAANVADPFAK